MANGTISADSPSTWPRWLTYAVVAVVLVGIGWRAARYLLQFPIWGDEAHIALNVIDRDFAQLTQPLRYVQAAPVLFLWAERAVYELMGPSELALRLVSFVAGVLGLLLFIQLARLVLPPLPAALAIGILAVAYYPVRHSCEVKSYGVDLFVTASLLTLAVSWLQRPERLWPLLVLALVMPVAVGVSYPSVFIGGAISLALLPAVWRQGSWQAKAAYVLYNATMLGAFVACFRLASAGQFESARDNWTNLYPGCFPPAQIVDLLGWLVTVHTGTMMAYPLGGHSGGSALTALLCLVGIVQLVRQRRLAFLVLCLVPFGLTLLASTMHRYPYGGSARYEQHLAPAICLLMAIGLVTAIDRLVRSPLGERRAALSAFAVLLCLGGVGLTRDLWKPQKTEGDREVRDFFHAIGQQAGRHDQVVVMTTRDTVGPNLEWYLRQLGDRVRWDGEVDWERLDQDHAQLWALYFRFSEPTAAELEEVKASHGMMLVQRVEKQMQMGWAWSQNTRERCVLYQWRAAPPAAVVRGVE